MKRSFRANRAALVAALSVAALTILTTSAIAVVDVDITVLETFGNQDDALAAAEATADAETEDVEQQTTTCHGQTATIVGTPTADNITGTPGRDVILALDGNDVIDARGGEDFVCGGGGGDSIVGGEGTDTLSGQTGWDTVRGIGGADILRGNSGNDEVRGNDGNDEVRGNTGNDSLYDGRGSDEIFTGPGSDFSHMCPDGQPDVVNEDPDRDRRDRASAYC